MGKKQIAYRQLVWARRAPEVFPMQDRQLWERAFEATVNGAVRVEESVEPEIAVMAIANPELAAEPGIGNVRQNKRRRE
jgi:hypothetical protein